MPGSSTSLRASTFDALMRTTSYFLGGGVIVLAVATYAGHMSAAEIANWADAMFGPTFTVLYALLIATALFCWVRVIQLANDPAGSLPWQEAGMHAAAGVATLALTYTLLGISLGIGSLADQELTTETVQSVIQGLTGHFSMAFMTTVIGLPTAALLRALLAVSHASHSARRQPIPLIKLGDQS